jgi:predicted small lipoprotein YifL
MIARIVLIAVLALGLGLSACGRKGELTRPAPSTTQQR